MAEPGIPPVKFGAEPGVQSGQAVIRLLNIYMQQGVINPFGKRPVAALFQGGGISQEGFPPSRERLGPYLSFAVDMGGRGGGPELNAAQVALRPEFAGHVVRLAPIHEELGRKPPMAVI